MDVKVICNEIAVSLLCFSHGATSSIYHVNEFPYILTYNIKCGMFPYVLTDNIKCGLMPYGINLSQVDLLKPFLFYTVMSYFLCLIKSLYLAAIKS